jgi:hypothetical protein
MNLASRLLCATLATIVVADPAQACMPIVHDVYFDFGSTEVRLPQHLKTIALFAASSTPARRPLAPKCERIVVSGSVDSAEAQTTGDRLGVARAETVRDALVAAGVRREWIDIKVGKPEIETGPGVREPRNRRVSADWVWQPGTYRCDPASEHTGPAPTCAGKYAACYLELADGTVCNFQNVPDPNRRKYSVVLWSK